MLNLNLTTEQADLVLMAVAAFSREQFEAGATPEHANKTVDLYREIAAVVRGPTFGRLPYFTEAMRGPVHLNWGGSPDWPAVQRKVQELFPGSSWGGNFADIHGDPAEVVTTLRSAGFEVSRSRDSEPRDLRVILPVEV